MRFFRPLVLLMLAGAPLAGWAFPDMIRHNYSNCTICHVSPTGGGLLTPYGRALSVEVLSSWGGETEGSVLHGLLAPDAVQCGFSTGQDGSVLLDASRFRNRHHDW